MSDWKTAFEQEIRRAAQARADGNEGMARVCARRAAGHAAGEYLRRCGLPEGGPSAYDRLRTLRGLPGLDPAAAQAAERLLLKVTPEYTLPVEADLLDDARRLCSSLLGE